MHLFASLFLGLLILNSPSKACCFFCGDDDPDSQEGHQIVDCRGPAGQLIFYGTSGHYPQAGTDLERWPEGSGKLGSSEKDHYVTIPLGEAFSQEPFAEVPIETRTFSEPSANFFDGFKRLLKS